MSEELELKLLRKIEELKREIRELKGEKLEVNSYSFSKITFSDLDKIINIIEKIGDEEIFDSWINNNINISSEDLNFLTTLLKSEKFFIERYKEEDLKVKFIAPILNRVDFKLVDIQIRDFYEESITYKNKNFTLTGICDFIVSKGLNYAKTPLFFIQEFKKGFDSSDPRPQLIAELISAIEINNFTQMRGAYIVGAIWNFVILEKLKENSYQYFVSENFDSTKINDLKEIYKNLLFVKEEIKGFVQ